MKATQFTVVIPLYNKANSIRRTLKSISNQRLQPSEIIVVDDGSTDKSAMRVATLDMPNLKLYRQKNRGVSAARNIGVKLAAHNHIAFLDADDQWSPFYLEEMDKLIKRFPKGEFFAANYQKIVAEGTYLDPKVALGDVAPNGCVMNNYFDVASRGDLPFMPSSSVITRSLFQSLNGFPEGEAMGEDQALFSKVALKSRIIYTPLVLMFYHTDAENRACDRNLPTELLPFAKRLLIRVQNSSMKSGLKVAIARYCAAHACHLAKVNIQAGNVAVARKLLRLNVCRHKPLHRFSFLLWAFVKSAQNKLADVFLVPRQTIKPNSMQ